MPVAPRPFALFGAALDCLDDPESLSLKTASILSPRQPAGSPVSDPYDAVVGEVQDRLPLGVRLAGKLPLPGHLRPRPPPDSLAAISQEEIGAFLASGGCRRVADQARDFLLHRVLPDRPALIGVDHSLTLGVLEALAGSRPEPELGLLVLDSHLDAIPLQARAPGRGLLARDADFFSCGNWLLEVLDRGLVRPSKTAVLGVTDAPPHAASRTLEADRYARHYDGIVSQGVTVLPAHHLRASPSTLAEVLAALSPGSLYLSIDVDAAFDPIHGACRFPAAGALGADATLAIIEEITAFSSASGQPIAGFDLMEADIHLLGVTFPDGRRDCTLDFLVRAVLTLTRSIARQD